MTNRQPRPWYSGHCGIRNPPTIHRQCTDHYGNLPCACTCHTTTEPVARPRLLDLFCGAGGATRGYQRAGFHVVGVDNRPQPRYVGDEFLQADALAVLADPVFLAGFDTIHASPPCHDHSALVSRSGEDGSGWLLTATRLALQGLTIPWVIENVPGSSVRKDLVLCGGMFGLRTYRHRWFEVSPDIALIGRAAHPPHVIRTSTKRRRACWDAGMHISITGDVGVYVGSAAMGIDWMTGDELSQAIPPAYTEFVGEQLLAAVNAKAGAA